jgi:hypothetical protein
VNSDDCPRFGWRAGEIEIGRPPTIVEVMRGFDQPKIVIVGGCVHGTGCEGVLNRLRPHDGARRRRPS